MSASPRIIVGILVCIFEATAIPVMAITPPGGLVAPYDAPATPDPPFPQTILALPPLEIEPIDGFTTARHKAPPEFSVPTGTLLRFCQRFPDGRIMSVLWENAQPTQQTGEAAFAECLMDAAGYHEIRVRGIDASGRECENRCRVDVVPVQRERVTLHSVVPIVAPVVLSEDMTNEETMKYFFGRSIASLRRLRLNGVGRPTSMKAGAIRPMYRTSVDRPIGFILETNPKGFESLMEVRFFPDYDHAPFLATSDTHAFDRIGQRGLMIGPVGREKIIDFDVYRVDISSHIAGTDIVPEGQPVTFTAVTDPPGYEDEITWISSTKYGTAQPATGRGPTFTTQFDNTVGANPAIGRFQWVGVKADNAVFGQDQKCPSGLSFKNPANGDVIPSDQLVWVVAQLNPVIDDVAVMGKFEAIPIGGGAPTVIHEGDIRSFSEPDYLIGVWDVGNPVSSSYTLHVTAQVGTCPMLQATTLVTINRAPTTEIALTACSAVSGGTQVTLEVQSTDPDGDAVNEFIWDFGDGSPVHVVQNNPTVQHLYATGVTDPIVKLTSHDQRGATDTIWRDLSFPVCTIAVTDKCSCQNMNVFSSGGLTTFEYCAPLTAAGVLTVLLHDCNVEPNPIRPCPAGQFAYTCGLGPKLPSNPGVAGDRFGWGFEVDATLSNDSNDPKECREGQIARGSLSRGALGAPGLIGGPDTPKFPGSPSPLPNEPPGGFPVGAPGDPYPGFGGPGWGNDGYQKEYFAKRHVPGQIRWWDRPSIAVRPQDNHVIQRDEFVAFVIGDNTCWCWIRIEHQWKRPPNGGHQDMTGGAPPVMMTKVAGSKCSVFSD